VHEQGAPVEPSPMCEGVWECVATEKGSMKTVYCSGECGHRMIPEKLKR
jgi:hypothetical protein